MKRFFLIICIFIQFGIISCGKKDEITPPDQFPQWLKIKITALTSEFNLCEFTHVTTISYQGKKYYHIYCGAWSCMYCELYDEKGMHPNWNTAAWNDFYANKKEVQTTPACQ